ncbi:MAG: hypothetical protein AAF902_16275 [Chloroflexota bacterium]
MAKPKFRKDKFTNNPEEAARFLLDEALEALPPVTDQFLQSQFISLHRTIGAEKLIRGNLKKLKPFVQSNLKAMSEESDFSQFKVGLHNKGAQVTVIRTNSFKSLKIWKTESDLAACGDPSFEIEEKKWWQVW